MKHINPIKHTTADNYEHFLSYMHGAGARHSAFLCKAYFDGSDAPHEEYESYMTVHPEPVKQEPVSKERILELAKQERVLIPGLIGFQDNLVEFARAVIKVYQEKNK